MLNRQKWTWILGLTFAFTTSGSTLNAQNSEPNQSKQQKPQSKSQGTHATQESIKDSGTLVSPVHPKPAEPFAVAPVMGAPRDKSSNDPEGSPLATQPVDWGPYMADLQRRLKRSWFPPKGFENEPITVQFQLHRGGELLDGSIKASNDVKTHIKLGDVYRSRGENEHAIEEYKTAAGQADNSEIEMKLGQLYGATHNVPQAIEAYHRAIGLRSNDPEAINGYIADWNEALKDNPLAPENHIGLGQAYQLRGDFGQAQAEYNAAIRLSVGKHNPIAERLLDSLPAAKAHQSINEHKNIGVNLQPESFIEVTPNVTRPTGGDGGKSVISNQGSPPSLNAQGMVDFGPYMANLQRRIKREWFPPKSDTSKRVVVEFTVHEDGELGDVKVLQPSDALTDWAAMKAVERASPCSILPSGAPSSVRVQYTFDYAVHDSTHLADSANQGPSSSVSAGIKRTSEGKSGGVQIVRSNKKQARQRNVYWACVESARYQAETAWQNWKSPNQAKAIITSVKISLGSNGKVANSQIETSSGSPQQDQSTQEFIQSLKFHRLPRHLKALDLFWTLTSDETSNSLEPTESAAANTYNKKLLGGLISRFGGRVYADPDGFLDAGLTGYAGSQTLPGQEGIDFGPYMADLQRRIKRAWFPPKGNENKRVLVRFEVGNGGELINPRVEHSSTLAIADQAALKAVQNAGPFRPLPVGAKGPLPVEFTFDLNMFGGGGHGTFRPF